MGRVLFYQLGRQPVETVLRMLIGKARERGWRVLVRGSSQERIAWLDEHLWLQGEEDFLPHGIAGGPHDARQPVLLAVGGAVPDDVACLISIEGAGISAEEARGRERSCVLFDAADEQAVARAREQWRSLTAAGLEAEFWVEGPQGWTRQARSSGRG